jgi:hypothetical protein
MVDGIATANAQSSLEKSHTDRTHDLPPNDALNSEDGTMLAAEASETAPPKLTAQPIRLQAQPPKWVHSGSQKRPQ